MDFSEYKNFGFKNNWILVKQHLNNEKVINALHRGIIGYLHDKRDIPDDVLYDV